MTLELSQTAMGLSTHSLLSVFCMFCFTKRKVQHSWNITGNVLHMTKSKTRDYNFNPSLSTLNCMALQKQCGKTEGKRILDRYCSQTKSIFDLESQAQLSPYDSQIRMEERQMSRRLSDWFLHKMVHHRYDVSLERAGATTKKAKQSKSSETYGLEMFWISGSRKKKNIWKYYTLLPYIGYKICWWCQEAIQTVVVSSPFVLKWYLLSSYWSNENGMALLLMERIFSVFT